MEDLAIRYMQDKIKEVALPSNGMIFKIKKISMRKLLLEFKRTMLLTNNSIKLDDKKNIDMTKISEEQIEAGLALNNKIVIESVIEPKISMERKDGCLCIENLEDEDFNFLVNSIQGFSEKGATDLKPFREEPDANNTRQNGEAVQSTAN